MDASPEVLESMGVAADIHEDDTMTPNGGKLLMGQGYTSNSFCVSGSEGRRRMPMFQLTAEY